MIFFAIWHYQGGDRHGRWKIEDGKWKKFI